MGNNATSTTTLWKLLEEYKVIVPLIQRDYAQGRQDEKCEQIRRSILGSIKDAFMTGNNTSMDFVYGVEKILETEGGETKKVFYPLDGQQRLTTLWLVHWYVFFMIYCKSNYFIEEKFTRLSGFSYETRTSSKNFCECLCKKNNIIDLKEAKAQKGAENDSIATIIRSRRWFLTEWHNDPTIEAMLRTLSGDDSSVDSCIEKVLDDDVIEQITNKTPKNSKLDLEDNSPITFEKFLLKDKKIGGNEDRIISEEAVDEVYIKMNARGKPLSNFENFKSKLVAWFADEDFKKNQDDPKKDYSKEYNSKLDGGWADIFWNAVLPSSDSQQDFDPNFDPMYFAFFNRFVLNRIVVIEVGSFKTESEDIAHKAFNKISGAKLDKKDSHDGKVTFTDFEYYKKYLDFEAMEQLKAIFDALGKKEYVIKTIREEWAKIKDSYSFIPMMDPDSKEGYTKKTERAERVYFYATCRFLLCNVNDTETEWKQEFRRFMRVVHNLVRNYYFNDVDDYTNCLRLIHQLIDKLCGKGVIDIYNYLKDNNEINTGEKTDKERRFYEQLFEEAEKADYILAHPDMEKKVIEAENYSFFDGTIRFLYRNSTGKPDWKYFETKLDNAKRYFKEDKNSVVPVETVQAFLRKFKNSVAIRDKFVFLKKGYDDRKNCWKRDILCNSDYNEQLDLFFKKGDTDQAKGAYLDFVNDEELIEFAMASDNGKWQLTPQAEDSSDDEFNVVWFRLKKTKYSQNKFYIGKERSLICKILHENNLVDESKYFYYNKSGYYRLRNNEGKGDELEFEYKDKKHTLKVTWNKHDNYYVLKQYVDDEKTAASDFFKTNFPAASSDEDE